MGFDERHVLPALRLMPYDRLVVVAGRDTFRSPGFRRLRALEPDLRAVGVKPFDLAASLASIRDTIGRASRDGPVRISASGGPKTLTNAAILAAVPALRGPSAALSQKGLRTGSRCPRRRGEAIGPGPSGNPSEERRHGPGRGQRSESAQAPRILGRSKSTQLEAIPDRTGRDRRESRSRASGGDVPPTLGQSRDPRVCDLDRTMRRHATTGASGTDVTPLSRGTNDHGRPPLAGWTMPQA